MARHAPLLLAATNDPLRFVTSRQRPWDGLVAQWRSLTLDAQLAAGAPADQNRLRQVRARQLTSPRWRAKLAARWDELVDRAAEGAVNRRLGAGVPLQQRQISAAAAEIRDMTSALRAELPVSARGVAKANLMLIDGTGPVYNPAVAGRLPRLVRCAVDCLKPTALLERY